MIKIKKRMKTRTWKLQRMNRWRIRVRGNPRMNKQRTRTLLNQKTKWIYGKTPPIHHRTRSTTAAPLRENSLSPHTKKLNAGRHSRRPSLPTSRLHQLRLSNRSSHSAKVADQHDSTLPNNLSRLDTSTLKSPEFSV